jgi:hypothetical protein
MKELQKKIRYSSYDESFKILMKQFYVVVIEELDIEFEKEISILKDFTSKQDRSIYLDRIIENKLKNYELTAEEWEILFGLYPDDLIEIFKKRNLDMTLIEKNLRKVVEVTGLKNQYIEEGIEKERLSIIKNAKNKGLSLETICIVTGLSEEEIQILCKNNSEFFNDTN